MQREKSNTPLVRIPPIAEQWESFQREVLPPDCSLVQRREMRRAFYAGARCLLSAIMRGLDPGTEPTEDDIARMEEIEMEFKQYELDLKGGRA